jgi:uncharacterized protein YigE (DUF2233 family)
MNRRLTHIILVFLGSFALLYSAPAAQAREQWKFLAKGIEYRAIPITLFPEIINGKIHIVRIDPAQAKLKLLLASEHDKKSRTTAGWCKDFNLVAAINAGMFHKDFLTNVGYLRNGLHIQNKRWNSKYKSILAFDPKKNGLPAAIIIDLEDPDAMKKLGDYNAVIQNLRLIKGDGINVWEKSNKKWSEAAVGMDNQGRILFLFCGLPYSMWEFNETVKSLGLGVTRLMHMEGGSSASLSIRSRDVNVDLAGTYEMMIAPNDTNSELLSIPNVIGVQTR